MNCAVLVVVFASMLPTVSVADALGLATNLGSQMGKATYCGFPTDEFARLAGKAIDSRTSYGDSERGKAIKQFILAARLSAQSGPVSESCSEFGEGYKSSLRMLRQRF